MYCRLLETSRCQGYFCVVMCELILYRYLLDRKHTKMKRGFEMKIPLNSEMANELLVFRELSSVNIQGSSNMTGTNCDLFTHKQSRSYLNHLYIHTRWFKYDRDKL